jgi:hypothetical protein
MNFLNAHEYQWVFLFFIKFFVGKYFIHVSFLLKLIHDFTHPCRGHVLMATKILLDIKVDAHSD